MHWKHSYISFLESLDIYLFGCFSMRNNLLIPLSVLSSLVSSLLYNTKQLHLGQQPNPNLKGAVNIFSCTVQYHGSRLKETTPILTTSHYKPSHCVLEVTGRWNQQNRSIRIKQWCNFKAFVPATFCPLAVPLDPVQEHQIQGIHWTTCFPLRTWTSCFSYTENRSVFMQQPPQAMFNALLQTQLSPVSNSIFCCRHDALLSSLCVHCRHMDIHHQHGCLVGISLEIVLMLCSTH